MIRSRFTRAFRRTGASALVLGLVGSLFVAVAPAALATPSPMGNFEIDGNQTVDQPGLIDWANVAAPGSPITEWKVFVDDGKSYLDSAKEQDPSTWGCAANEAPPKDDILRLYLATQISTTSQFLHVGYVRATGTGDTDVNVEFNRKTGQFSCPGGAGFHRSADDVMISFTFPGGDGAAVVDAYKWVASAVGGGTNNDFVPADGHWTLLDKPAVAGATNAGTIKDPFYNNESLAPRTFGELTVDLSSFFQDGLLSCPGGGYVNPHSRASHDFASDLKDILPESPFDLSDCGSLKLKKVDDAGRLLKGVTFGLYQNNTAADPVQFNGQDLTCETDADGICFFPKVPHGTFILNEVAPPDGYDADTQDLPATVTIDRFSLLDLTDHPFVNPRKTGSVTITKSLADSGGHAIGFTDENLASYRQYLLGASFGLLQDDVPVIEADGHTPAACSPTSVDTAHGSASCTIDHVLYGSYVVHETAPAGTAPLVQDQQVVVNDATPSVSVRFTNILNPDTVVVKATTTPVVDAGDPVAFTLHVSNQGHAPALGVTLTDPLSPTISNWTSAPAGPSCSTATGTLTCDIGALNPGDHFDVTLTGTSTPAACPGIENRAYVSSTNETPADALNNDSVIVPVTVKCPDVSVVKTTTTPSVDAGDPVRFAIVASNAGPGEARNVRFSDPLPGGVDWSVDGALPAGCGLSGGTLSCTLPTLASGSSVTVNVKGVADSGDCAGLHNPAFSVRAENEPQDKQDNNTAAAVDITVNCPSVKVTKTGNGPINAGDTAVYTITVRNIGDGAATAVVVSDPLPAGVNWEKGVGFPEDCALTDGSLECTFPSLAAGSHVNIVVQGTTDATDCPSLRNAIVSARPSNGEGDTFGPADIVVNCPDMAVTKTGNGPISAGDPHHPAQYTITITNHGLGVAHNASFQDNLPGGLSWAPGTPFSDACSINAGHLACSWPTFAPGSVIVSLQAITSAGNCPKIENPISSVTADNEARGTLGDNSTAAATIVVDCPDLGLSKVPDAASVSRGDPIGFSMKVWNSGPGTAFGSTLDDPLPAGFTWAVAPDSGGSCSVNTTTRHLFCDLGDLVAGSSLEQPAVIVHVVARDTLSAECGPYVNTATVASTNGGSADDSASVTLLCPGVNIVKEADSDLVDAGSPVGYTLEVTNAGPGEAKGVAVTDNLPGHLGWAVDNDGSSLPDGATCDIVDGVLTCQLGNLPASETVQARIHVVGPTSVPTGDAGIGDCDSYRNVASAASLNGGDATSDTVNVDVRCPLGIGLTKTGLVRAHVGDTVTYNFSVTNTGYVDLVGVNLVDPICDAGTIVQVSKGDGDGVLAVDTSSDPGLQREVWTYRCTRVIQASDPDPLPNTAAVTGTDADHRTTTAEASWSVDILHPAITIDKTADPVSLSGPGTVTYTYVVTNTGDTTLFDVLVTDDILGAIGSTGTLAPGQSITMAKTVDVDTSTPPTNIGTVVGTDVLGESVTASDSATITVVLGAVETRPAPAQELPRTGAPLEAETRAALALIEVGLILELSVRYRRRTRRRAG